MTKVCTALALGAILTLGCASREAPSQADLLLTGAEIMALDAKSPAATSVAIRAGRIVGLGSPEEAPTVLDLGGAVVAPALVDHHVHLFNIGLWLLNDQLHGHLFLDLSAARSADEVARLVQARADSLPPGAWVLGAGWNQAAWGTQDLPGAEVLTRAAPTHPVFLARTDGHAGWVNAKALAAAGVRNSSGILLERANEPVTALIPALPDSEVMLAYGLATEALASRGVVEVYDAGALAFPGVVALNADFGRALTLLRRTDSLAPLAIRVNLMVPAPSRLADSLLAGRHDWVLSPRIRITHLKLFADGALGSRGAALTHPYADQPGTRGVARMTTDDILRLSRRALDAGLGVATHAIGDEAVRRTLDAYEQLLRGRPGLDPTRLRVEHFSYAREADFTRAVRLGVTLSIQSNFNSTTSDEPPFGALRVGAANERRVYAWDRLERMGAHLAEGSDYFARPAEPLAGFAAALTRRNAIGPARADSEARVLAYRMQSTLFPPTGPPLAGLVADGARADLVILSANPLTAARAEILGITVLATINGGRLSYASTPWLARATARK